MKALLRGVLAVFALTTLNVVSAQDDTRGPVPYTADGVLDGVYVKEHIPTKKVIPYEFVREADVTWSRRVWRVIDLREKFNHPLYYPLDKVDMDYGIWFKNTTRWSLWTVIRYHVLTGDLTLYSPYHPEAFYMWDGEQFKYPVRSEKPGGNYYNDPDFRTRMIEYLGFLGEESDMPLSDINGNDSMKQDPLTGEWGFVYPPRDTFFYESKDIVQYKIKEDWFFDKERSVLDVRIIGLAPVRYKKDQNGNITGLQEMFWLYFPECRYVFQNFYVQSRNNDSQRMSFDDLFWKRMFQSYAVKESNLYDRDVDSYKAGVDALLEAEKIKDKIFKFEHDLWSL